MCEESFKPKFFRGNLRIKQENGQTIRAYEIITVRLKSLNSLYLRIHEPKSYVLSRASYDRSNFRSSA